MPSLADRLRIAVARRFFVALRRATHRLPVRLAKVTKERVLVVAPHHDDEAIPCGGTLLLHARIGSTTHVVFATDSGGPSSDPAARTTLQRTRQAEAAAARGILGYTSAEELGFADGSLVREEAALEGRLEQTIRSFSPERILCPFPADSHADHQAAAIATSRAAAAADFRGDIWAYEVWAALWPTVAVDISAVVEAKEAAIACYASQLEDRDYVGAVLGLNRYRGLHHRVAYAEAYHACTAPQFCRLTAQLDRIP